MPFDAADGADQAQPQTQDRRARRLVDRRQEQAKPDGEESREGMNAARRRDRGQEQRADGEGEIQMDQVQRRARVALREREQKGERAEQRGGGQQRDERPYRPRGARLRVRRVFFRFPRAFVPCRPASLPALFASDYSIPTGGRQAPANIVTESLHLYVDFQTNVCYNKLSARSVSRGAAARIRGGPMFVRPKEGFA